MLPTFWQRAVIFKSELLATLPRIEKPKSEQPTPQPANHNPNSAGVLGQNIPNPTNGITTISYETYTDGVVEIRIYNIMGQCVKTLPQGNLTDGKHQTTISLTGIPAGIYHYVLYVNGERADAKKMVIN